jgi:hypothetical protein
MMISALKTIALAIVLLGVPIAVAAADDLPKLDVTETCNAAAFVDRNKIACLEDELSAQSALVQKWSKYSASDKAECVGTVKTGGPSSYVELLSCLEAMRDARGLPEGETLAPDRPGK